MTLKVLRPRWAQWWVPAYVVCLIHPSDDYPAQSAPAALHTTIIQYYLGEETEPPPGYDWFLFDDSYMGLCQLFTTESQALGYERRIHANIRHFQHLCSICYPYSRSPFWVVP